jgi:hypothetical protein
LVGPTNFHWRAAGLEKQHFAAFVVLSNEQWSHVSLSHCSHELFFKKKPVQLIDFILTVHVNNNFFCLFKKLV